MQLASSEPATAEAPPEQANRRYHALDFLRGLMMLLGIAFHCGVAYDDTTLVGIKNWPTSEALGFLTVGSHAFRMPIFFILAGFFAALLYSRRTQSAFVRDRAIRIGVPLAVGYVVLAPAVAAGLVFTAATAYLGEDTAWQLVRELTERGDFFFQNATWHLWFLYYLLLFYAAMLLGGSVARPAAPSTARLREACRRVLSSAWRVPALVIPAAVLLYIRPMRDTSAPDSFVPEADFLLLYGFFFGFGLLLFVMRETLAAFARGAWPCLLVGLLLAGVYRLAVDRWLEDGAGEWRLIVAGINAMLIALLFFGLVGVLLKHLDRPLGAVRYAADASYWCYLVHFPLAVWLPGLLMGESWAPEVKFVVVLATVLAVCLASYELFVRSTFIGRVLNGRRYPSAVWSAFRLRGASPEPTRPA